MSHKAKILTDGVSITGDGVTIPLASSGGSGGGMTVFNVEDYGAVHDGVTDDTSSIQAAINAAYVAGGGIVYFPSGTYIIGGALVNSAGTGIGSPNSQLYIEYETVATGTGFSRSIKLLGETPPAPNASALGNYAINNSGAILYSTITGTGTIPSILGSDGSVSVNGLNIATVELENLTFRVKANIGVAGPTMSAVNLKKVAFGSVENVVCDLDVSSNLSIFPIAASYGIIMPGPDNGAFSPINNTLVTGYKYAYAFSEHSTGNNINAIACEHAFVMNPFGGSAHDMHFGRLGAQWCKYTITGSGTSNLLIENLDIEHQHSPFIEWFTTDYIINDNSNLLSGHISYHMVERGGALGNSLFNVLGGANLEFKFIDTNTETKTRATNIFSGNRPLPGGYTAYNGVFLGSTTKGSVIDFMHNNVEIMQGYSTTADFNFYTYTGKTLNFFTNGNLTTPVLFMGVAKLGVNNATPAEALDVTGNIKASGNTSYVGESNAGFVKMNRTKITGNYTVVANDYIITVDNGASNITITLPSAATSANRIILIKRYDDTSIGTITINTAGGNIQDPASGTFGSSISVALWGNPGYFVRIQSNAVNFEAV